MNGYLEMEDGKMYYEVAGAGEWLVLSHAGFVDSRMWDEQWEAFSQRYHTVRFDMIGFGKSSPAQAPVDRRAGLYRLLQHLGISRAILVGCSMSGEIALDFALEHPEMAAALVLVSMVPVGFEMRGEPPREFLEMLDAMQQGDLERTAELQVHLWIDGPFRQPDQVDRRIRRRAAEMSRIALANDTWHTADSALVNPLDPPAVRRLGEVHLPVLIIAGELDNPEIARAADVMESGISGSRKVILPGCAHLPNMERPDEFNRAVLEFLAEIKGN